MEMNPYLTFAGTCEAAFRFYEQTLGGKIVMMQTHAETPMAEHVPAEWGSKVMHAHLQLGDRSLMGSDAPPDRYQPPAGFSLALQVAEVAEAERIFGALAEGGQVQMPLQQTFWAERFGMLVDRFGIPWMVNCGEGA